MLDIKTVAQREREREKNIFFGFFLMWDFYQKVGKVLYIKKSHLSFNSEVWTLIKFITLGT